MDCCKVPGCRKEATTEWAQVNLCEFHHDVVDLEQTEFYEINGMRRKVFQDDRKLFYKIVHLMPSAWGRKYIYPIRALEVKSW